MRKKLLAALMFLVIAMMLLAFIFPNVKAQSDPWWNTDWKYRRQVTIDNTAGGSLTDFQVKVTVPYEPSMQPDLRDIRFVDSDGSTVLNYWIESMWTPTQPASPDVINWKYPSNPLNIPTLGYPRVVHPDVLYFPNGYLGYKFWMFYEAYNSVEVIALARSNDGITWTGEGVTNPIVPNGPPGSFDSWAAADADVVIVDGTWYLFYCGAVSGSLAKVGLATSTDGLTWTKYDLDGDGIEDPVFYADTSYVAPDGHRYESANLFLSPTVYHDGTKFWIWLSSGEGTPDNAIFHMMLYSCVDPMNFASWTRENSGMPVMSPTGWEGNAIWHIDVSKHGDEFWLYYVAPRNGGSMGFARSNDKFNWIRSPRNPIMVPVPGTWEGSVLYRASPIEVEDEIWLYYSAYGTLPGRIGLAKALPSPGNPNSVLWVKVPSIPAGSTKTIYMYYGNPSATPMSNGDNTFIFFDDFNDNSLDLAKWQTGSGGYGGATPIGSISEINQRLEITQKSSIAGQWVDLYTLTRTSYDFSNGLSFKVFLENMDTSSRAVVITLIPELVTNAHLYWRPQWLRFIIFAGQYYLQIKYSSGTIWVIKSETTTDLNRVVEIQINSAQLRLLLDGVVWQDWVAHSLPWLSAYVYLEQQTSLTSYGTTIHDNVSIRKCIPLEPTTALGPEEIVLRTITFLATGVTVSVTVSYIYDSTTGSITIPAGGSNYITVPDGSTLSYEYPSTVSGGDGVQFVLESVIPSSPITITSDTTVTGNYKTQYLVTFSQTGLDTDASGIVVTVDGSAKYFADLPFSKWVDSGTSVSYIYEAIVSSSIAEKRYRLDTVTGPPSPIIVTSPITVTGNYVTQYYLTVNNGGHGTASGEGWYDSGVYATFSISPTIVYEGVGTRYVFTQWSGDSSSTNPSDTVLMNGPKTVTANWKTQYQVTFEQTGSGATVHVDYTADTDPIEAVPFSTWIKADSLLTFSYDATVNDGQPTRYVLVSVDQTSPLAVNGPITITATYKTQHYLTVGHSPIDSVLDGHQTGQGYYDANDIATVTADLYVDIVSGASRYMFDHWSGDTSGTSTTTTIVMSTPKTAMANYKTQYYITVTSAHGSPTASDWADAGSDFTASVTSPTQIVPNDNQWVCTGFSVDGAPYQVDTTYTFINVETAHTINFAWKQQFWIQVNSVHDSPTVSQWVDQGGSLTVSVTSPADDDGMGTRYRCTGYTLDSNPPVTDGSTTYTFTDIENAHTITFNWIAQYRLTVVSDHDSPSPAVGEQWYDTGTTITATVTSPADESNGIRFRCTGWTGTGSVPASGTLTSVEFTIDTPSTLTWNWIVQYYLTMSTNFGTVSPASGWFDTGTMVDISATAPSVVPGERYVWNGWTGTGLGSYSGPNNPTQVTMSSPITESASWTHQYYLNVVSVYDTPGGAGWYDAGSTAYASLGQGIVSGGTGIQYIFIGWSGDSSGTGLVSDPITMDRPKTATANWKTQYYLSVSTDPPHLDSPTGADWYDAGTEAIATVAQETSGWSISHWHVDGVDKSCYTYAWRIKVTMDAPHNAVALYKINLLLSSGFKAGDTPSNDTSPYLTEIMCVLVKTKYGYKLAGTAPGTYDYATRIYNTGTTTFSHINIVVTGTNEFYLKGGTPVRVLDANGYDISSQFTILGAWPSITMQSNAYFQGLPGGSHLYAAVHLDYNLKGTIVSRDPFYFAAYLFQSDVSGMGPPDHVIGTETTWRSVAFLSKKTTIIYGFVIEWGGKPIEGAIIDLYHLNGTLLNTEITDADAFFCFINEYVDDLNQPVTLQGGTTYKLVCTLPVPPYDEYPTYSQGVTAQTNKTVYALFPIAPLWSGTSSSSFASSLKIAKARKNE